MTSAEVDLLEAVLGETEATIAAVRLDQLHLPTPCTDYDVADLTNHLVGWARAFAARFSGASETEDPNAYRAGPSPAAEFHEAT
jgi:hypothetical protein